MSGSTIVFNDLPNSDDGSILKTRIDNAWQKYINTTEDGSINLIVSITADLSDVTNKQSQKHQQNTKQTQRDYKATAPKYKLSNLIVSQELHNELVLVSQSQSIDEVVFKQWGLNKIQPYQRTALNFSGPPGTGKTFAAHAIADALGKKIIVASYAQIESMYHGEGPKNVQAIFEAASEQDCVLFIDEADSLLSQRLSRVTQGSEQAINSMRSQLLICLEQFDGVVIFASNFTDNYDKAFESRIKNLTFPMPALAERRRLWELHLVEKLPLSKDVSVDNLADIEDINGREIRNAVIEAARYAALHKQETVTSDDLLRSINAIKRSRYKGGKANDNVSITPLKPEEQKKIRDAIKASS